MKDKFTPALFQREMNNDVVEQLTQFIRAGNEYAAYHLARDMAHWGLHVLWLSSTENEIDILNFIPYQLPDGRIVYIDASTAKGASIISFTLADGTIIPITRR